ncbi:autotransporter outer membrane beta-barrel domain-containing protein, partial [Rhizobium ruizarguesonis]
MLGRAINKMAATSLTLRGLLIGALGAALVALSAGAASAQVALWTGASSTDWTSGTNWSTGTAPVAGQTVNIGGVGATRPDTVLGIGGPSVVSIGGINVGQVAGVSGALTIQNGSRLTSTGISRLAIVAGSSGTVTVTGSGSQWNVPLSTFQVGFQGTGTLNIENGGQVTTGSNTVLGGGIAASGTLNISSGGTLQTLSLRGGNGTSQANFDNGILRATAANAAFVSLFSGTELNLLTGGLTIDTAGFTVGTDATSGFSGVGGLTVTGGGVFSLLANSIYTGETQIDFGS